MDVQDERQRCQSVIESLVECGLATRPNEEQVQTYLHQYWLYYIRMGCVDRLNGYDMLASLFHALAGDVEYNNGGPDSAAVKSALDDLARVTAGMFLPQDAECAIEQDRYCLAFTWKDNVYHLELPADPYCVPVDELVIKLNEILAVEGIEKRFWGVTPPPPAETAGYLFATIESVREAKRRGLLWSSV